MNQTATVPLPLLFYLLLVFPTIILFLIKAKKVLQILN